MLPLVAKKIRPHQIVGGVDGGSALDGHVEHLHVVEDHQDVGDRVAVRVLDENQPLSSKEVP